MSGALVLRRWQAEALPLALADIDAGRHGVVVATTGAGKSIFLAELLRLWMAAHPGHAAIVVSTPSRALVEQLAATLGNVLGAHRVGRYYTKAKQHQRDVVVCCNASAAALAARWQEDGRGVSLWIADECHKTESDQMLGGTEEERAEAAGQPIEVDIFRSATRMGLTATPFRSSVDESLSLFDHVIYRYAPADALRDGVIVPWRFVGWPDDQEAEEIDRACISMIQALGKGRGPGVVNAKSIDDAEAYAMTLTVAGIEALPIHSRMTPAAQADAIRKVRAGDVDCLVHVAMLVEGVDYPWLRWGCFRRQVHSRIRFIQELGRFLRAHGDKSEAVILDPHDLAGTFQVTYGEALGWVEQGEEGEALPEDPYGEEEMEEKEDKDPNVVRTARRTALARYVRMLHLALIAEGVCLEPERISAKGWREDPVSDKQYGALSKMVRMSARLGAAHRQALGAIVEARNAVTKGIASDLFELLNGVRKLPGGKVWTPAAPVPIPPATAWEAVADPYTYVAGAKQGGQSAVAIMARGEVLYTMARPSKAGDTFAELAARAAHLALSRYGAKCIACHEPDVVATFEGARLCKRDDNPAARVAWQTVRAATGEADRWSGQAERVPLFGETS